LIFDERSLRMNAGPLASNPQRRQARARSAGGSRVAVTPEGVGMHPKAIKPPRPEWSGATHQAATSYTVVPPLRGSLFVVRLPTLPGSPA